MARNRTTGARTYQLPARGAARAAWSRSIHINSVEEISLGAAGGSQSALGASLQPALKESKAMKVKRFESLLGFASAAEARDTQSTNGHCITGVGDWYGPDTYAECLTLARSGWPEGLARMGESYDAVDVSAEVVAFAPRFDVAGAVADVPRFLAGAPDSMVQWDPMPREGGARLFSIAIDTAVSAAVSNDAIEIRGAAVCSLVDALESTGRRVLLDWLVGISDMKNGPACDLIVVPLKGYEHTLDLESIAFAAIHPGATRRLAFALHDMDLERSYPAQAPVGYDLIVPSITSDDSEKWTRPDVARQWVRDALAAQGVETVPTQ